MSPGIPVETGPVTPDALGLPSGPTSAVLVQSSGRCPSSKELVKAGARGVSADLAAWDIDTGPNAGVATATARTTMPAQ
jgi:hypothetical protein